MPCQALLLQILRTTKFWILETRLAENTRGEAVEAGKGLAAHQSVISPVFSENFVLVSGHSISNSWTRQAACPWSLAIAGRQQ